MSYIRKGVTEVALPHDFDCNEPALNDFLLKHALESESRGLCTTHLFCNASEEVLSILGYFSLATTPIDINDLSAKLTKRYPHYVRTSLTVTLLARLALDKQYHGQRKGGILLMEALKAIVLSWQWVGTIGVLVHAKHNEAAKFYQHFGFRCLPNKDLALFMSKKEVLDIVSRMQALNKPAA